MSGIVIEVDIVHIDDVAAYFAQLPAPVARLQQLPSQRGKTLFFKGREGLVACAECHGLQAQSQSLSPWLDAQHGAYLVKQLQDFKHGRRDNDPDAVMRTIASKLTDEDIEALARYLESTSLRHNQP